MNIKKISKSNPQSSERPYRPPYSHRPKNKAIIEILGGANWYDRHLANQNTYQDIYQEAGIKENIMGGILGAIILVLSGYSLQNASRETNISEAEIEQALQDSAQIDQARDVMKGSTEERPSTNSNVDPFIAEAFKYIGGHEGIVLEVYNDTKGIPTIGVGHKILPGEDFSGGISREEAMGLFAKDVQDKLTVTKSLFTHFDSYPNDIKIALLDGVFRGDHKRVYRTTKLINSGDWVGASEEYVNDRPDYDMSKKKGTGVVPRMDENAKRMKEYGKQLGQDTV